MARSSAIGKVLREIADAPASGNGRREFPPRLTFPKPVRDTILKVFATDGRLEMGE